MIEPKIQENISLAPMTTFRIGGQAKYFVKIRTKEELAEVFEWIRKKKINYAILSGGSNVLISDDGFGGIVVKMENKGLEIRGERIEAGAGTDLPQIVRRAIGGGLSGLEWAIGIPGSLGGAIRGNAGAFGGQLADCVETVEVFNIKKKRSYILSGNDCKFSYRESIFKKDRNLLIWSATLRMKKGEIEEINKTVSQYLGHRNSTQPKLPSAGCIFKNVLFSDLQKGNRYLSDAAEREGLIKGGKVGAGWIISRLDLQGKKIGGTKISLEHANFIVNTGKARAEEVVMMISFIKQQVRDRFGVQLQEEIEYLGF
ncbi:UDP-N-acetylenolpyruvoylglucosamine reductase [Candidatus Falkowbacteria bacterium RIFOXYB2_FULL_34_18]|uniref:UDP-N-acetylenolpyruvoylglucosamine reductase n=1 Tax=Candidatus Falkowbacteria bacterium RIFOXYD2_FULL_34_120 TaxID=1798007 RepID=A0A1F5TMW3_9BACT|nr:MAG: UDP-N-acetylenolpyruvoylglucosamine reductase [Candidatus Falkowbacteria bacterium RIFOXYC12_FULL_34_55]OGF28706.1 MAG: UDP-N-acetylenolpyruvoylglucosamine reductase [Candidatus Falkowbacteria bacterium RIFOXYB2_FULL_34_18]OGF38071.1 MAG: UDP-N-acetylenolpyruvoylglucosamine reductase [Candidatus Falkowbacteria bacterium RIFOXYC2_FULL_34_220]OGF38325.1 MAG: UDP-N-acetylenolpyruvoylglucosamine reductase [Candidatus Falkowbacteria bacterium RIFOXYD12_FULL_34_57]OGF40312.1 MAG: UDP-N-acetyl